MRIFFGISTSIILKPYDFKIKKNKSIYKIIYFEYLL